MNETMQQVMKFPREEAGSCGGVWGRRRLGMRANGLWWVALCVLAALPITLSAQVLTRTYALRAGWNSIYLDLNPTNTTAEVIFSGLPVVSAWRPQDKLSAVEFIADPSEPVWNRDTWMKYVPTNRVESLDNNLFRIEGGRPFLIQLSAAANWTVRGTPYFGPVRWKPDAYNFKGFPVDPDLPPSFEDFFRYSTAHYSAAGGLQPIYALGANGRWERVRSTDLMDATKAYWVYTAGPSGYVAPLEVVSDNPVSLNFGRSINESILRLINRTPSTVTVGLTEESAPGSTALMHGVFTPATGTQWEPLGALLVQDLLPGLTTPIRLAANRTQVPAGGYQSYLDIRDYAGTKFTLPVLIQRQVIAESAPAPAETAAEAAAKQMAGLWMGVVTVNKVSESHSGQLVTNRISKSGQAIQVVRQGVSAQATETGSSFDLRVLLHVSSAGETRLLHEVWQMWQDGTYRTLPDQTKAVDKPGRFVLVTEESLLSQYQSAVLKDGRPAGRRLSSAGFYFPSTPQGNQLLLTGLFGLSQTNVGGYLIPATDPRNPFYHKYHPDHDNLDNKDFKDFKKEAFDISRQFQFEFKEWDEALGSRPADYGYGSIAGVYRETVTGLHRETIRAEGTFRLRRVAESGELNPAAR